MVVYGLEELERAGAFRVYADPPPRCWPAPTSSASEIVHLLSGRVTAKAYKRQHSFDWTVCR